MLFQDHLHVETFHKRREHSTEGHLVMKPAFNQFNILFTPVPSLANSSAGSCSGRLSESTENVLNPVGFITGTVRSAKKDVFECQSVKKIKKL